MTPDEANIVMGRNWSYLRRDFFQRGDGGNKLNLSVMKNLWGQRKRLNLSDLDLSGVVVVVFIKKMKHFGESMTDA